MPITKSAEKALRQSVRRQTQNLARKEAYKLAVKKVRALVGSKKEKEAREALSLAYQALDKAAKTNVISQNTAARKKSRLTKFLKTSVK